MTHTRVPKQVTFNLDDVEIAEIVSRKLVAARLTSHHAKSYEFSDFVVDANPIAILTHGNEVNRIWHEKFSHLKFKYL